MTQPLKAVTKPKLILLALVLLVIGAVTFNACRKSSSFNENITEENPTVQKAITWFNGRFSSKLELDDKGEPKFGRYPNWRFANTYSLDKYTVVEVPFYERHKTIWYKNLEEKQYLYANNIVTTINKLII